MPHKTGFIWHELFMWHHAGKLAGLMPAVYPVEPGRHFETPESKRRVKNLMDASAFTAQLTAIDARMATDEELARVHDKAYIAQVVADNDLPEASAGFDAPFTRGSVDIARLAAGGAVAAVDAIVGGDVSRAYLLARPSGHHAERETGKGVCIFNTAAVAATQALEIHGLERVAFVDLDVHHGNGAENIFWRDPRVLTISLHQENWFPPASGGLDRIGEDEGEGFNINVPLPAGCGFGAYRAAFERVVLPALEAFRPQMIFVPFGYDAGAQDPMGRMILSSNNFRWMAQQLCDAADRYCGGRLLATHEGGYNEATVPFMALAAIEAISGLNSGVTDPYSEIFDNMHGHDLLPHQEDAVEAAAAAVPRLASRLRASAYTP